MVKLEEPHGLIHIYVACILKFSKILIGVSIIGFFSNK